MRPKEDVWMRGRSPETPAIHPYSILLFNARAKRRRFDFLYVWLKQSHPLKVPIQEFLLLF